LPVLVSKGIGVSPCIHKLSLLSEYHHATKYVALVVRVLVAEASTALTLGLGSLFHYPVHFDYHPEFVSKRSTTGDE